MLRCYQKSTGTNKERLQDYSQIFSVRGNFPTPKRILVHGRPGIGKSTFAKKLATDWSRGKKEILKDFDVLLLINLRDVCNIPDVCTMLKRAELLSADDPVEVEQLYDYILRNQQKVLLIFDGYDECSAEKSSLVHQIWKGNQLRDCTVLVTTREKDELMTASHAIFEIGGFERRQVNEFASKFLNDQVDNCNNSDVSDVDNFTDFLTELDLWDIAEVPLLLLMLCLLWKEKYRLESTTRRADLYEGFFQTLFDHWASKNSVKKSASRGDYKEDLLKLGQMAFVNLLDDSLHPRLSKLPGDIYRLVEKLIPVGFFQISQLTSSPYPENMEKVVCFLHKSVQEYLAALFIVWDLNQGTTRCLSKVDCFEQVRKIDEVLKFTCELSSKAAGSVFSHLQKIGRKEGLTENTFDEKPSIEELTEYQKRFLIISLDCFLSCRCSYREALYPLFLQCVNRVLVIEFDRQLPIVARQHFWKSSLTKPDYVFFHCTFEDTLSNDVLFIVEYLKAVVVTCGGDKIDAEDYNDLYAKDFFIKKEGEQMIIYLTRICKDFLTSKALKLKALRSGKLLNDLTLAPERTTANDVPQRQDASSSALLLTEKSPGETHKHSLTFIREIKIDSLQTSEIAVVDNVLALTGKPRAIEISFSRQKKSCNQLVERLVSRIHLTSFTNNLHSLKLNWFNLSKNSAADIARSLHQVANLRKLDLSYNTALHSCVSDLAKNLHHVPQLTELLLCDVGMGKQECRLLATSLKYVNKLQVLRLSINKLGRGIFQLAKQLRSLPCLIELSLRETQMREKEVAAIARALRHLPQLKELCVSYNPLGRGVTELTQHLNDIPQLKCLWLLGVKMTTKEAIELCRAGRRGRIRMNTYYHVSLYFYLSFVFTLSVSCYPTRLRETFSFVTPRRK